MKKADDYESIYSVNPLYLCINHASGHIEKKNLIFDSADKSKELLKNMQMFGIELKRK